MGRTSSLMFTVGLILAVFSTIFGADDMLMVAFAAMIAAGVTKYFIKS